MLTNRHVLVTGAYGFIGKNLTVRLGELEGVSLSSFGRGDDPSLLSELLEKADCVVHLAGENRPAEERAFEEVNTGLTRLLCEGIKQQIEKNDRYIPLILASSTQAKNDSPYGRSKLEAELALKSLANATNNPCKVFRLPGVFGKWCKPNYNSVVATFCHNLARNLPIQINDPSTKITLVYVDDVISAIINSLSNPTSGYSEGVVEPQYSVTLGELSTQIRSFSDCRSTLLSERVGTGFVRALYATYVSYLPNEKFSYDLTLHGDQRGVFVEMLKTKDSGQFSYFTAHPGITRGGHYHHTKTEKFLVVKGEALFRFRHLLTNELVELRTNGETPKVVDTIPGWTHDITNVGDEEMVVMLWANENFDRQNPDTVASEI